MKNLLFTSLALGLGLAVSGVVHGQDSAGSSDIRIIKPSSDAIGQTAPILIALTGFTGEAADVLRFDLTVQGFKIVSPDAASYLISGSDTGGVTGGVTEKASQRVVVPSRNYTGAETRRLAHAFADDIVKAITGRDGIGKGRIAYKSQPTGYGAGEIYVADFDGANAKAVTSDNAIVAKPAWTPGKLVLYYTSYARGNPDIFVHDLTTGQRNVIAGYSGLNTSAAVSPDGARVAMVLSKTGRDNIWVSNADGSAPKQLTTGVEDSSPCWSPDGKWICYASKDSQGKRQLTRVSAEGGAGQPISIIGVPNPTEPDWSPDGKWIAFTAQMKDFHICVIPAGGGQATVLVPGENPSWSPNSRTLVYNHSQGHDALLAVLDTFTKQSKDCARAGAGNRAQPAWQK